eukprot:TRINITY_DN5432_c0_g1_i1.p1 TRINITY_DN5432_c0_g1~~TRINITY_DN5432_c0_g1_i1.p1  ORF type:complete len:861 (-),score=202.42 TRINITY_DN5432_c0_g1_i1:162-2720(-)
MGENWLFNVGSKPGLVVFRIDNRSEEISRVANPGVFRSDDCYLAIHTAVSSSDLYLWVGKSTKKEQFAKERLADLEKSIGNIGTISTVTQEHESGVFQSFFKQGITYVQPLVLKKRQNLREDVHVTRLYHLKGRRQIRVAQIDVDAANLNSGDVFILDTLKTIYQWNGKSASRMEKGKALDLTVRLRDERMNRVKADVMIIDEGKETDLFWSDIGGQKPIAPASSVGEDADWEKGTIGIHKLYRVSDESGEMEITLVDTEGKGLAQAHLDPQDSFILDTSTDIFVWNGRKANFQEKSRAFAHAKSFLKEHNRPDWTPVTKVAQGVEPALFKSHFRGAFTEYIDTPDAFNQRVKQKSKVAAKQRQEKINVDALHHPEKYAIAREELVYGIPDKNYKGGSFTEFEMFFVKEKKTHALPEEDYGIFYSKNCYVVRYSVRLRHGGFKHVIYYWQGRSASTDDNGSSALLAQEISQSYGRSATLVRVSQGKEPDHFLSHFQGFCVVRNGHRENWAEDIGSKAVLYQVRGTTEMDATASQVPTAAHSLNSNDAFVLVADKVYVWEGAGSNEHERATANSMVDKVQDAGNRHVETITEKSEPAAFWEALGGKEAYSNADFLTSQGDVSARLFQCTDKEGVLKVFEIFNFTQDDLDDDDAMIVDAHHELFVWLGSNATDNERKQAQEIAAEYVKKADDGRDTDGPIYVVNAGYEPLAFTVYFQGWDAERKSNDAYFRRLTELKLDTSVVGGYTPPALAKTTTALSPKEEEEVIQKKKAPPPSGSSSVEDKSDDIPFNPTKLFVDYDRLKTKPTPEGVDGAHLEAFLTEEQFNEFMKIDRATYYKLPKWKALRVKKASGLF